MKQILMFSVVAMLSLTGPIAQASVKTCKVTTNDVGVIVGRGKTDSKAFEDAAIKCFDKRSEKFKVLKGQSVDEETGIAMIDACANIKCGEG